MIKLRFINQLLLLSVLTISCFGCAHRKDCKFSLQSTGNQLAIPSGFGINIDFTDPRSGEIRMLADAGFRWVRMDFKWDATEKEPGRFDFSAYDSLMAALAPYNIRALFILDYGNPLYDNGAPPRTLVARQAFARWAVAAARHFAGREVLWEIYNEPNHSTFWPPQPNAQDYVALAAEVGRTFQREAPNEKLIGPATSEVDFDFLEACFKAGLLEYWSAVSIHPYRRRDPETAADDYCRLRDMIRTYAPVDHGSGSEATVRTPTSRGNDRASSERQSPTSSVQRPIGKAKEIPIISSEWGYSSAWPSISNEKQGELLARSWLTNLSNGIPLSIWYDWRDDGMNPMEPEHHFGTVFNSYHEGRDPVYDPKPAYLAAKTMAAFFNNYRFEKRLDVGSDDDYVLVFRNDDQLRFAVWTTASEHRVELPLSAGRYTTMTHTGQNSAMVMAGEKGFALNLTTAPVYIR